MCNGSSNWAFVCILSTSFIARLSAETSSETAQTNASIQAAINYKRTDVKEDNQKNIKP